MDNKDLRAKIKHEFEKIEPELYSKIVKAEITDSLKDRFYENLFIMFNEHFLIVNTKDNES